MRIGAQRRQVRAVVAMHGHALAPGDESCDRIPRHGHATAGELRPHVLGTADDHSWITHRPPQGPGRQRGLGGVLGRALGAAERGHQPGHHVLRAGGLLADRDIQRGHVRVTHVLGQAGQHVAVHQPGQREAVPAHHPGESVPAGDDSVLPPLPGVPLTDLRTCPGRADEGQPVLTRPGRMRTRREDRYGVPVVEGGVQSGEPAIDSCAHALITDVGVDGIGEVDRGGPLRQRDHVTLGGEHEHLVGVQVKAQAVEELAGLCGFPLPVENLPQPGGLVLAGATSAGPPARFRPAVGKPERPRLGRTRRPGRDAVLLVLPVRRDPVLGPVVHRVGPDLQLHRLAVRPHDRRVQ